MYQKAIPAGAAGYITPSYGMEEILKPQTQEESQTQEPQIPEIQEPPFEPETDNKE